MSCQTSVRRLFTDTELKDAYGNGKDKLPLLPNTMSGPDNRDTNKLLTEKAANDIIQNLILQGVIPVYDGKNQKIVENKQKQLIANAKEEFDFYYVRYTESLRILFDQMNNDSIANNDTLNITRLLNTKLNDLVQIIMALNDYIYSNTQTLDTQIATFQQSLEKQKNKLVHQHKVISSDQAASNLNKEMVKYTEQKAKYTDNLLKVYSVLNIVALGLLVYVFRSTTD